MQHVDGDHAHLDVPDVEKEETTLVSADLYISITGTQQMVSLNNFFYKYLKINGSNIYIHMYMNILI